MDLTLTNTCSCIELQCPECNEIWVTQFDYSDEYDCIECNHHFEEPNPRYDNLGYCYEWDDQTMRLVDEIKRIAGDHFSQYPYIYVTGSDMGWLHNDGFTVTSTDVLFSRPWEIMSVNTEWTQDWTIEPDAITVRQSHHDAPTGESYAIYPSMLDEEEIWDLMEAKGGIQPYDLIDPNYEAPDLD